MAGSSAKLTGRTPNKAITKSALMTGNLKSGAKRKPVTPPSSYLDTSQAAKGGEPEAKEGQEKVIDISRRQTTSITSNNQEPIATTTTPAADRVSRTKNMLRKHMFYTKEQLDRTSQIADELMHRRVKAREQGTSEQLSSEMITRNTFIRASVDAVLSFFTIPETALVDNEQKLRELIIDQMKKNVKQRSK